MRVRKLAINLSNLENHSSKNIDLEQYSIEGDLAAKWLSDLISFGDLKKGFHVTDLGAGNGILGIGALLLGAEEVIFIESDPEACKIINKNIKLLEFQNRSKVYNMHIDNDNIPIIDTDLIITNPPWGRQKEKADKPFLQLILDNHKTAHILHNSNATHISNFFLNEGWEVEKYGEADFLLPATYSHHKRQRDKTKAGFWRVSPT
ncbi:MAG: hypothetical protein CND89_04440 [Marine Group II euryarchaeote MED-G38]|nr:hypothetical protein [Euryarchaeota archaeon]OUV24747.1 MAG: hypothetical protein CBC57_06365 [Euryarchaeota archaeon TMED97]PDH22297.1 MAG: hypothetical protein CND89_04440 [Marine Group II euryarchaeote MED-G38]|tara:strand:+ start:1177 stop:1791 length:615 start_codon:yes stop_codon:yes gene_type:complete